MRILSLEIRRNATGYTLTMLGQLVENQAIVGQVRVANDKGAEVTLPLSPGQIEAALVAIAGEAAADANALVSALTPPSFGSRPALEHAPLPLASLDGHAPAESDAPVDPLVIEAGKHYRTRDGLQVVEVTEVCEGADVGGGPITYPVRGTWRGGDADGSTESWTKAGRYYAGVESENDLVALVPADALA